MEPGPVLDRSGNQRNPAIRPVAFILTQPGSSIDTLASVTDGQLPLVVQPSGQAASKDLEAFLPKFLSPFDT